MMMPAPGPTRASVTRTSLRLPMPGCGRRIQARLEALAVGGAHPSEAAEPNLAPATPREPNETIPNQE